MNSYLNFTYHGQNRIVFKIMNKSTGDVAAMRDGGGSMVVHQTAEIGVQLLNTVSTAPLYGQKYCF